MNRIIQESISLKEMAKLLNISPNHFIKYLLDNKYIYKSDIVKKNVAYKQYSTENGSGIFYIKEDLNRFNGHKNIQTKITTKGIEYFKNKFKERNDINGSL